MKAMAHTTRARWSPWARALACACLTACACIRASAQPTGHLRFRFEPAQGVEYVLDGSYRLADREIVLPEGAHRFVFWAPQRRMLDTTLTVVPGRVAEVPITLRYSTEYIDHRRREARYRRDRTLARTVPPLFALGAGVWAASAWVSHAGAHATLKDLGERYARLSDPAAITRLKELEIPQAEDDLERTRTQAYIATAAFATSLAATWWLWRRSVRRSPPVFEDRERLRFEGLVWAPGRGGAACTFTFAWAPR